MMGRSSGTKMVGMVEVGAPIIRIGWNAAGLLVCLFLLSSPSPLTQKMVFLLVPSVWVVAIGPNQ